MLQLLPLFERLLVAEKEPQQRATRCTALHYGLKDFFFCFWAKVSLIQAETYNSCGLLHLQNLNYDKRWDSLREMHYAQ